MFCGNCGAEVPDDIKFCPKCGHDLSNVTKTKQTASSSISSSSIIDMWNGFSMVNKIIVLIAVCCMGLLILGFIGSIVSPDANTSAYDSDTSTYDEDQQIKEDSKINSANDYSSSSLDSNDGIGDSSLQVRVIYSGSWDGAVGTIDSSNSVSGSGNEVLNIDGSSWDICSAVIQKKDSGNGKLTVQIIKDGKIQKESSTTSSYGVVSVSD